MSQCWLVVMGVVTALCRDVDVDVFRSGVYSRLTSSCGPNLGGPCATFGPQARSTANLYWLFTYFVLFSAVIDFLSPLFLLFDQSRLCSLVLGSNFDPVCEVCLCFWNICGSFI